MKSRCSINHEKQSVPHFNIAPSGFLLFNDLVYSVIHHHNAIDQLGGFYAMSLHGHAADLEAGLPAGN